MKPFQWLARLLLFSLVFSVSGTLWAGKFESKEHGFSIDPPAGWSQQPSVYEGVAVTYWKEGGLATFHVIERNLEGVKTVADLKWEDLFSPRFDEILVRQESDAAVGGEKARYCIYKIKPGPFKQQMEGKNDFKYMNYVIIHGGRLYSITFKDLESAFSLDYYGFLEAVRSISFFDPRPVETGKTASPEKTL